MNFSLDIDKFIEALTVASILVWTISRAIENVLHITFEGLNGRLFIFASTVASLLAAFVALTYINVTDDNIQKEAFLILFLWAAVFLTANGIENVYSRFTKEKTHE